MSPSLDGIVTAVVERLQAMQRRYPQHRRPPRGYTKSLKEHKSPGAPCGYADRPHARRALVRSS